MIAQGRLDLNSCKNRLSGEEKRGGLQLRSLNCFSHSHTKDPTSSNSSESFHSIGGQLALTELTPWSPPSHNPFYSLFPSCQSVSPQFTPLMESSGYADFSCINPPPTASLSTRPPRQPVWQIGLWDTWHQFKRETRIRLDMWFCVKKSVGTIAPAPTDTHTHPASDQY